MRNIELNTFKGKNAIRDFLHPEKNPYIPLVELPPDCNPFQGDKVRIFAKLMNMLPLANVKSLPAYNMLLEAEESGKLKGVHSLIENSSGNTVFSLATIARLFGIEKTKAIVSHEVTWGKLQLLRLFGTHIIVNEEPICPDPNDKTSGIFKAKRIGKRKRWFNPGQYDNEANPRCHEKWTAPQIWEQTEGKLTIFCAGLGTTGTLVGAGGYLKKKNKKIIVVGVARSPNNPVPGVRTPNLLREIAFDWQSMTDYLEEIGTKKSFAESLKLCQAGLMTGPSSGFALAGLVNFLKKQKGLGKLDDLRNSEGEVVAVFICPDTPLPYLNEYFEFLDASYFPPIENEEILINKPGKVSKESPAEKQADFELDPEEAYSRMYPLGVKELWRTIIENKKIPVSEGVKIIDLRSRMEFEHFHLPGSKQIDFYDMAKPKAGTLKQLRKNKIFMVCAMGNRTRIAANILREKGLDAYSIKGGVTEWSRLNLPRWRPEICKV